MKRIRFDESKFEKNEYIEKTIALCKEYGGIIEIDMDFCVYAYYDGMEHWIGYAEPYDLDWFDAQFKCDSGGEKCQKDQKYQRR